MSGAESPGSVVDQTAPALKTRVAFVGAGISRSAGLPLFDALRDEILSGVFTSSLVVAEEAAKLRQNSAGMAPEFAISTIESAGVDVSGHICEWFRSATPHDEHRLLQRFIEDGGVVFTPNFDCLIESAGVASELVGIRAQFDSPINPLARLVKLHGSCPGPLLARTEQVINPLAGPWASQLLDHSTGADLLVWGYRGADLDLGPLVKEVVSRANTTTWICFSGEDVQATLALTAPHAVRIVDLSRVVDTDGDRKRQVALNEAAQVLGVDPGGTDTPSDPIEPPTPLRLPNGAIAAIAGQLGGPALGRRAWRYCLVHGPRLIALRNLVRSMLFDSEWVQRVSLAVLTRLPFWQRSATAWRIVSLAADGEGVSPNQDRWTADFDPSSWRAEGRSLKVLATMATVYRRRGELARAEACLLRIGTYEDRRQRGAVLSASWEGRLIHEELALRRRQELVAETERLVSLFEDWNSPIVGANWLMWINDELAGIAINKASWERAEQRLNDARQLAAAYGDHPLARIGLGIRRLQLQLAGETDRDTGATLVTKFAADFDDLLSSDPARTAELSGLAAEFYRRIGDMTTARRWYSQLAESPNHCHRLAAWAAGESDPATQASASYFGDVIGDFPVVDRCVEIRRQAGDHLQPIFIR